MAVILHKVRDRLAVMTLRNRTYWVRGMILGAVLGMGAGVLTRILMPQHWSNLAWRPSYVSWFMDLSDEVYFRICELFGIDWFSDEAPVPLLHMISMFSLVLVFLCYGALLGLATSLIVVKGPALVNFFRRRSKQQHVNEL